ncbi:MAG: HAMP domain-containing histidine kinase [Planctomycetes bacterium]|nr:HAMP domain-containing histidine kinase [Planctomycetota bacterium]
MTDPDAVPLDQAKIEALAEFAAGAGHEINNPVATIVGRVQLLLRSETDPERRQALKVIAGQAYRIRDMIGDLMLFARPPQPEPIVCCLSDTVRQSVQKLQDEVHQSGAMVETDLHPSVPVWADPVQLAVVVTNLVRNALGAVEPEGLVRIATQPVDQAGRTFGLLTVWDNGVAMDDEERQHAFDPFFSGRQAGRGLGFGLPKCWRIVTNHGGRIEVHSSPKTGTTFHVSWPASR